MPEINRSETLQKRLKNHALPDFFDALRQIFNIRRAVFVGERRRVIREPRGLRAGFFQGIHMLVAVPKPLM